MVICSVADGPVLIAALGSEEAVSYFNMRVTWRSLRYNLNQISLCHSSSICAHYLWQIKFCRTPGRWRQKVTKKIFSLIGSAQAGSQSVLKANSWWMCRWFQKSNKRTYDDVRWPDNDKYFPSTQCVYLFIYFLIYPWQSVSQGPCKLSAPGAVESTPNASPLRKLWHSKCAKVCRVWGREVHSAVNSLASLLSALMLFDSSFCRKFSLQSS